MAATTTITTRRGMLTGAATLPIAALSLAGTPAIASALSITDLLRDLARKHRTYLGSALAYRDRPCATMRLIADTAEAEFEMAQLEVLWAAEDLAVA